MWSRLWFRVLGFRVQGWSGPDCVPALSHCSAKRQRNCKPRPKFFIESIEEQNTVGEHNLEHKFAVSDVELEGDDRGMKSGGPDCVL